MQRQKILKQAKEKVKVARRLLKAGSSRAEVDKALRKQFGSVLGSNQMVRLRRDLGLSPAPQPKIKRKRAKVVTPDEVVTIPAMGNGKPDPVTADLKVRLGGIFGWMRQEGISRLEVHRDNEQVTIDRTEVLDLA